MYYTNRIELGQRLGQRLTHLRGQEVMVLALRESAMTACIGLASELHAWVFPLLSERIYIPGDPRLMGLIGPDGMFTWSPDLEKVERDGIEMDSRATLEDAKREAFSRLNRILSQYGEIQKEVLTGRSLLLTGDIVEDRAEIAMALEYLKSVRYEKLYGLGGNVDAAAADYYHLQTDDDIVLDVMTHMFPADHYFEQKIAYSPEECRQLAMNISSYWT